MRWINLARETAAAAVAAVGAAANETCNKEVERRLFSVAAVSCQRS